MTEIKYCEEPIPASGAVRVLMRDGLWIISEEERDRLLPGWRERERPVEMPRARPTEPHVNRSGLGHPWGWPGGHPWGWPGGQNRRL